MPSKFGELPEWVPSYLKAAKVSELEKASVRLLKATTLEDVLQAPKIGAAKKTRRK